ncbi:MAG: hypothetical protein HC822_21940 [Oscillochloris sp.]|nr:hypothetical protein [Oscillochloris sp.]
MKLALISTLAGAAATAALSFSLLGAPAAAAQPNDPPAQSLVQGAAQAGPRDRARERARPLAPLLIRVTAEQTNQAVLEVTDALVAGQTLGEVATGGGSSSEAVIDAVAVQAQARLDQAVQRGRISQERADEMIAKLRERATEIMADPELGTKIADRIEQAEQRYVMPALVRSSADQTGLAPREIVERLRAGETLEAIVQDAGGDINAVIDDASADFRAAAAEAVR